MCQSVHRGRGSPWQRSPGQRSPPWQRTPWTETPRQRPPQTETSGQRPSPGQRPPVRDPPLDRDLRTGTLPWTETLPWTVCGPESTFCIPYKVMIRVPQLVLFVLASIGWHHCRTQNPIGPLNWSTVMWPAPIGWWCTVSPAIYTTRVQDPGLFFVLSLLAC